MLVVVQKTNMGTLLALPNGQNWRRSMASIAYESLLDEVLEPQL